MNFIKSIVTVLLVPFMFACVFQSEEVEEVFFIEKIYSPLAEMPVDGPIRKRSFCNEFMNYESEESVNKLNDIISEIEIHRKSFNPTSYRASVWLPKIKEIVKAYGLPEDVAYVPVVESKFKNVASAKGAGGFWQLMPATARENGLIVNDTIDERLDPIKSTHAACRYIKKLRRELPNWSLTFAAYNAGLGKAKRTINRAEDPVPDFFSLNWNLETDNYIYRLYAVKEVLEHREEHGIKCY